MAKYRVLQKSFVGNRIVEEGAIVDYEGEVSDNLEPVEAAQSEKGDAKTKGKSKTAEPDDDLV